MFDSCYILNSITIHNEAYPHVLMTELLEGLNNEAEGAADGSNFRVRLKLLEIIQSMTSEGKFCLC